MLNRCFWSRNRAAAFGSNSCRSCVTAECLSVGLSGHWRQAHGRAAPRRIAANRGGRRKNLGRRVRVTAYRKTLLTLSTQTRLSSFSEAVRRSATTFLCFASTKQSSVIPSSRPRPAVQAFMGYVSNRLTAAFQISRLADSCRPATV